MPIASKTKLRRGPSISSQRGATEPLWVSPFEGYNWGHLSYPELSPEREQQLQKKLQGVYESRCRHLPFLAAYLSFEKWYRLYRVYMRIGDKPRQIIPLMMRNLKTDQIAAELGKSKSVIDTQIGVLRSAFGAETREYLIFVLLSAGIVLLQNEDGSGKAA